ncbi:MAG: EAL domain-containing protein [Lachnospiraceae bacterium]|nr:EAL domain-containing protein [Lachnospiraceae bacterium]
MKGLFRRDIWNKTTLSFRKASEIKLFRIITDSLEALIPVFLMSALVQVFLYFPIPVYQNFIHDAFSGMLFDILNYLDFASYGMLSVYMTLAMADNINSICGKLSHRLLVMITALSSFMIASGIWSEAGVNLDLLGPKNIMCAIICGMISSYLYIKLLDRVVFNSRRYVDGISMNFSTILISLFPMMLVLEIFAIADITVMAFGFDNFYTLMNSTLIKMFSGSLNSLGNLIRLEIVQDIMWALGIHGSDALSEIKYQLFDVVLMPGGAAEGANPILSGAFIDVFVLLGGCGSTWSLVIALMLFSKQRNDRFLARVASVPMIFNINELILFGLPVVFNPIFVIPFLFAPIVNILISYSAMASGIVPVAINAVNWTTPVIFGGYMATGSVMGSLLQIVCIAAGVFVYMPFVKINDHIKQTSAHEKVTLLETILKDHERDREPVELLTLPGDPGKTARTLAAELSDYIDKGDLLLYYQPQYDNDHKIIGAEALLRWNHDVYGAIYPPLAIELAEELGRLTELEEKVFLTVFGHLDELLKYKQDDDFHISINVTGITIQTDEFEAFLKNLHIIYPGKCKHVMVEITEQATLRVDESFISRLTRIKELGYTFGIDDFSMGNTSIKYLQSNIFDIVKLDGGISRDIFNTRSREIIYSISRLTEGLNINTIAEYVETEEQRKALENAGCHLYQGYLYSPAIPLSEFGKMVTKAEESGMISEYNAGNEPDYKKGRMK